MFQSKFSGQVCPTGKVEKFLGKIGHKMKKLLEKWKKW